MPTLFLLCGLPGSGKTTLAKHLECTRPALRFTEDEWLARLFGVADCHDDRKRDAIKAVQWETAAKALQLGVDVVLDWGFWMRSERDDFRARARALGARPELRFLDVPRDELWTRLAARNASLPRDTFHVDEADLDTWWSIFEPPTADELA